MKVLCYGSLNIDYVYQVPHFVRPGETLSARDFAIHSGGKGLNQSIALARAGLSVSHGGKIGADGQFLLEKLQENQVDTSHVTVAPGVTGHAIIQVEPSGQNCILLHGGNNQQITEEEIRKALQDFTSGDILLIQNEVNAPQTLIRLAKERGMEIVMNPAPMDEAVKALPLEAVNLLILNEIEGHILTGEEEPAAMADKLLSSNPAGRILITLGTEGSYYRDAGGEYRQPVHAVQAIDTTAAGDTFTGYFLAGLQEQMTVPEAMNLASRASALCVSRPGAADSIPHRHELG